MEYVFQDKLANTLSENGTVTPEYIGILEDKKDSVVAAFRQLVADGVYSEALWNEY